MGTLRKNIEVKSTRNICGGILIGPCSKRESKWCRLPLGRYEMDESMSTDDLKKELPPPGELINVNGRKIHVQRAGIGSPTVVFESALFGNSLSFARVQPEISKITSTLSYDRAGLGYSEPSPNPERVSAVIASELFELLETLDLREPLVLVGWSAGGIYIREFAHLHPEMVAGMVFIDSSHEAQKHRYPEEIAQKFSQDDEEEMAHLTRVSQLTREEILKELADAPPWRNRHPDTHKYFADQVRPETFKHHLQLIAYFGKDTDQEDALKSLGDIPLTVISRSNVNFPILNDEQDRLAAEVWHGLQNELAELSTNSRQIKVDSGHDIANQKPGIVIETIKEMIAWMRLEKQDES
jgi:pimeloyl-ACP methyl ester carboxylesterase